jgi:polar amino acid transport system permease protein
MTAMPPNGEFAVLHPFKINPTVLPISLKPWHGAAMAVLIFVTATVAYAQTAAGKASAIEVIIRWMPVLLKGFAFNILISILSMALGTALGLWLGLLLVRDSGLLKKFAWVVTQFFRNAPWLVILFFAMYMMPYEIRVAGLRLPLPDWIKAVIGLALPVMANVAEVLRGAIQSIPSGQWEAARSLAFSDRQIMWKIVLPQCVKRALPPWMNIYSIVTMNTVQASIVGVTEMLTLTAQVHAAEGGRPDLLAPLYAFALLCFFVYCYPINLWTVHLERRFDVRS